jgi:hypothetical protein
MPKIEGLKSLQTKLRKLESVSKRKDDVTVTVGYTQRYAIYVHERDLNYNRPGSQWKYLETPAREKERDIAKAAANTYGLTGSMEKALIIAGMRLIREAEPLVPVNSGALKASWFVAPKRDEDEAATKAFVRSEFVRMRHESRQKK